MLKFNKNYLFVLVISLISFSFSQDGCDLPEPVNDGYLFITSDGNVLYNSKSDIYGFQFNVNGGTLTQGSIGNGGASEEAEFDVTVGLDNLILGFIIVS